MNRLARLRAVRVAFFGNRFGCDVYYLVGPNNGVKFDALVGPGMFTT